jgi:hypothetical protein
LAHRLRIAPCFRGWTGGVYEASPFNIDPFYVS